MKNRKPVNMVVRKQRQKKPVYTKLKPPPKKIASKKPKPKPRTMTKQKTNTRNIKKKQKSNISKLLMPNRCPICSRINCRRH